MGSERSRAWRGAAGGHLHGPVEGFLVEAGGLVCRSADDYRVNGGATTATGGVVATLGWGRMPSMEWAHNLLNHANTVSVEDNSRKRSYSHSHANTTVTETTSLHAWCRDNRSERVVA
jgi:hypothetical protein